MARTGAHRHTTAEDVIEDADKINEIFKAFDMDGNGKITIAEFKRLFKSLEPSVWTDEKVTNLVKNFDTNKDGVINFTEFVTWSCNSKSDREMVKTVFDDKAVRVAEMLISDDKHLFSAFDADSDKKVNKDELTGVLQKLVPECFTEKQVQEMTINFDKADLNKDGKLTLKEFIALVCVWHENPKAGTMTHAMAHRVEEILETLAKELRQKEMEAEMNKRQDRRLNHSKLGKDFLKFVDDHPYVARSGHSLHQWVQSCREEIFAGNETKAKDILLRMTLWDQNEEVVLKAAFERFDYNTEGNDASKLSKTEVRTMFEYLGFPGKDEDINEFFKVIDSDHDSAINMKEFRRYVGRVGGMFKIYEVRRKQLDKTRRDLSGNLNAQSDIQAAREDLLAAGVMDDAQGLWRLVVPESELVEVGNLLECQRKAVRHIRALAAVNHANALPGLKDRFKDLGYTEIDLKATLDYIREQAPLIIHIDLDKMMQWFEEDTHYRNQFETHSSGGCLSNDVRREWEQNLFGDAYNDKKNPEIKGFDRPKYGVLNVFNDPNGITCCEQYGDSYLIMKDCRLRVTGAPEDSCMCAADRLSVLDFYGHVLSEYPDEQLKAVCEVANGRVIDWTSEVIVNYDYKELQYHGEIRFDKHIERLVANESAREHEERLKAICSKHGWAFSWMKDDAETLKNTHAITPAHREAIGDEDWRNQVELRGSDV